MGIIWLVYGYVHNYGCYGYEDTLLAMCSSKVAAERWVELYESKDNGKTYDGFTIIDGSMVNTDYDVVDSVDEALGLKEEDEED